MCDLLPGTALSRRLRHVRSSIFRPQLVRDFPRLSQYYTGVKRAGDGTRGAMAHLVPSFELARHCARMMGVSPW